MKSELAEELLNKLMGWNSDQFRDFIRRLEAMAVYKYDEYHNFRPGMKFFESLASWLAQFSLGAERSIALDFVINQLLFISNAQMTHLIELVYPNHIEAVLLDRATRNAEGYDKFAVSETLESQQFRVERRRSLILGASDGAHLDRLRRSAPTISHEQFLQSAEPQVSVVAAMCSKLQSALQQLGSDEESTFRNVFLIDDFYGSGKTLIQRRDGDLKGKIPKLRTALSELQREGLVAGDVEVTVILYVLTEQARRHVEETLASEHVCEDWNLRHVQELPNSLRVDPESPIGSLTQRYYDGASEDEHKGHTPLGYSDCALPLVLSHNTPNNSISLLWSDTTEDESSNKRRALFPRYERHHKDRP